jgi:hypothetical protein
MSPSISFAEIDALVESVAATAGCPRHLVEVSFGRLDATDVALVLSIVIHVGKLPGARNKRGTVTGCGATVDEALTDLWETLEGHRLLLEHEAKRQRGRRSQ